MDTYTRSGLTFDVTDSGPADGRVVILLHGFPEDRHCWDRIMPALNQGGYRTLAADQRGYSPGARPRGRRPYAMSELGADVLALADAAGAERFDLVGHDWGGGLAWDVAARNPDRVRTVTVLGTPHPGAMLASLTKSAQGLHSWYMLLFQIPWLPEALMRLGARRAPELMARDGLDIDSARRYATRMAEKGAMTGPVSWYRAIPFGATKPMPKVDVPTLYIWSDRDRYLIRKPAELTAGFVTGPYRFEVLAGRGHWLPSQAGDEVSALLLEHLAAHTE